jgi:hypothetical protein
MNDLDLIQRFRADVPAPDDERVRAARARLMAQARAASSPTTTSATRPRDHRGHRPRQVALRLGPPAAAALAATAAGIVLVSSGVSGNGTSTADAAIIRRADAALAAPPNRILHTRLEGDGLVAESWQLTSAPYSYVQSKGPIGALPYAADNGTIAAYYDPTTNTIHQTPSGKPTASAKPTAPDNPLTEIKQELHDGRARVLRTATVDGTSTYAIQLADNNGFDAQGLIAYVDQSNYRPIEIADPQRNGTIVHLRVVALEYLPTTRANLSLLSLTARYPSAAVVNDPTAAAAK